MSLFFHFKRGFYHTTPYRLSGALTALKGVVFVPLYCTLANGLFLKQDRSIS